MKYYATSLLVFLLFLLSGDLHAQQDPQYTQYMYNPLVINPAYAGNRGVMSILGLYRSQWVGLDGAPSTQNLSVHSPIGLSNVGLGFSVVNDQLGPARETYFNVDFSYTLQTSAEGRLSFGLKGVLDYLNVDFTKTNAFDESDPFLVNVDNKLSPNVGVGLFYHGERFYLGVSAPNLLKTEHYDRGGAPSASSFLAKERIHYYGLMGYVFDLDWEQNIKFKPSTMVKAVSGAPLQVDVNANFMFYERLTLGVSYRWSAALSALAGFQVTDGTMIGFAYDRETTDLGRAVYNKGSYEVFLRFEIFKDYKSIISPRFF